LVFDCVTIKAPIEGLGGNKPMFPILSARNVRSSHAPVENKFHGASGFDRYPQRLPVSNAWC
jgi:hypothetical protein